jgi:hypothetical protein
MPVVSVLAKLFTTVPLHNIRYGIRKTPPERSWLDSNKNISFRHIAEASKFINSPMIP